MFDKMYRAETPKIAPNAVYIAPAPTGKTATKGPSQFFGSVKAIMLAGRMTPAWDLHAAPYAKQHVG
jgi:hypothetical protein